MTNPTYNDWIASDDPGRPNPPLPSAGRMTPAETAARIERLNRRERARLLAEHEAGASIDALHERTEIDRTTLAARIEQARTEREDQPPTRENG